MDILFLLLQTNQEPTLVKLVQDPVSWSVQEKLSLAIAVISAFSAIASTVAAFLSWKTSEKARQISEEAKIIAKNSQTFIEDQTIRNSHVEHEKLILDLNKEVMRDPELSAVFDKFKDELKDANNDELKELLKSKKLDAYIYYHLNLYHLLHTLCYEKDGSKVKPDYQILWKPWKKYIEDFFKNSSKAKNIFCEVENLGEMYDKHFIKFLETESLIKIPKDKKP